ncbi:MAG: cyclic nucleotide-binding domain-containing protein [Chloroflexi bacterium]|nr:cyclic nucleotide-binding domain-containing protein [Chloroflexota bacterium]
MNNTQSVPTEMLKFHSHFAGLSEYHLKQIANLSHRVAFEAGEELFVEGMFATNFCILVSGEVNIVYQLGDGQSVEADTLIAGDSFCWSAFLEPHHLTATCVSNKKGEYIGIGGEGLRKFCNENPSSGHRLALEISKLLRDRLSALRVQIAATQTNVSV